MSSLNDQVIAYLATNNLTAVAGDFQTASIEGVESIIAWNTAKFGAQPGVDQLTAALTVYQVNQARISQSASLSSACQNAILAGYTTTLNGQSVTFTLSDTDQTNCLMAATVAQSAVASAGVWAANSAYQFGQFVLVDENYYICMVAGTSGATAPSFPEAFQSPVTDGTAVWALLGALIGTTTGNIWLTVQEIFSIYAQGVNFVTTQRAKNMALQAKIQSAATVAEVLAISW